jgi:tRNA (guanine-N7-)-methyltransferase
MVRRGMRRYRDRSPAHAALVGAGGGGRIDPVAIFGRRAPLRLELGCGHGEFLAQMAAAHPAEDFLGVERLGIRVTKTAHKALAAQAANVRIFEAEAAAFVRDQLPPACLHRCYILFPDPWPKRRHHRRRLVDRRLLVNLAQAMLPGGRLVFTSDHHGYAMQVLSLLSTVADLWHNAYLPEGYRFDLPVAYQTVFGRHRRAAGASICHLLAVRTVTAVG